MCTNAGVAKCHSLRVCHVASGDLWGGAEAQITALMGALRSFPDLDLSAVLLNRGRLSDELTLRGIPVTIYDESRLRFGRLLMAMTRHLRECGTQIVHSHRYKEHILGALAAKLFTNTLTVQTYHGLEENLAGWASVKLNAYAAINVALGKMTANGVVGVSSEITRILQRRYPSADVRCIRNAVDLAAVVPTAERMAMRAQLGVVPSTMVVGTVARLMPIKGIEYLIEAFAKLRQRRVKEGAKLVIVGDGPLRAGLEQCVVRRGISGDVQFLGGRTDTYNLMNAFDVFVLPSLHEGVPMALLEAMALGVPVVASRVGGIPEVVEDGKEALLVPPSNSEALAIALDSLASSLERRSSLAQAALARARVQFSIQSSAAKTREIYLSLHATGKSTA